MTETPPPGRRERKKAQTRQALADAAVRLFLAHGYDAVTVAQVAAEADTAVTTLFKHFPDGKTALVFEPGEERADALVSVVHDRPAGTSPVTALRTFMEGRGVFDTDLTPERAALADLIATTPELRAYARHRWEVCEGPLADALAAETGGAGTDPDVRALARYVLQVPDLASDDDDPLAALGRIFDRLERAWA